MKKLFAEEISEKTPEKKIEDIPCEIYGRIPDGTPGVITEKNSEGILEGAMIELREVAPGGD